MRKWISVLASLGFFSSALFASTLQVVPTTTLKALTENNTSAADSFKTQSNGNAGAANVSKLDIHELLYPGARTRIIAHLMPWFGDHRHMQVGYLSWDQAQIHRQITDMISRGIDGVIIDWYGPADDTNVTAKRIMQEAEQHPGFTFAIMVDKGAVQLSPCIFCKPQQTLEYLLRYVDDSFVTSPAYMRIDGRPVITNFDVDYHFQVNWERAAKNMTIRPVLIFENSNGFTHAVTDGSYSWVKPRMADYGKGYMSDFYKTGQQHPKLHTMGASYKGFNDTLASWSANRVMGQQCGETWLQTFAMINDMYNSTNQLELLQLPTWNDYEEGTEVESGIDNCISVTAKISGNKLKWSLAGDGKDDTIDHYQVYISKDGKNLMPLERLEVGSSSMDLCSYSPADSKYWVYVQAVGKPNIRNQMSNAATFQSRCEATAARIRMATASVISIHRDQSTSSIVSVAPVSGSFTQTVALSCSGLPAGVKCSFSPDKVVPGNKVVNSTMTITASSSASLETEKKHGRGANGLGFLFPGMGIAGVVLAGGTAGRKRLLQFVTAALLILLAGGLSSCGNSWKSDPAFGTPNGVFQVTVHGDSGTEHTSTNFTLTLWN